MILSTKLQKTQQCGQVISPRANSIEVVELSVELSVSNFKVCFHTQGPTRGYWQQFCIEHQIAIYSNQQRKLKSDLKLQSNSLQMYFFNHLVVFLRYLGDPDKTDILIQSDLVALKLLIFAIILVSIIMYQKCRSSLLRCCYHIIPTTKIPVVHC